MKIIKVTLENEMMSVFYEGDKFKIALFGKYKYKIWKTIKPSIYISEVESCEKNSEMTNNDWYDFKAKLQQHYDFCIGDEYKPDYIDSLSANKVLDDRLSDELVNVKVSDKFIFMDDCARWFKSQKINAEIGLDYIFIKFENSEYLDIKEKKLSFEFLKELSDKLECKFTITSFIPNENDDSFPWYCRKRSVTDKGILIELDHRKFGDSGGPVFSEDF